MKNNCSCGMMRMKKDAVFHAALMRKKVAPLAGKDITEKILEAYNDVFADIVNVLLFDGAQVLKPEELTDQAPRAAYKADGKIREIERDVAKRWSKQNIRIACVGLENQTKADPDMPLRVIGYDGAEYRAELNGADRYPVVTLVLYFGHERHWDQPKNLLGCFDVPEVFKPYVRDYEINLFEIAYLSEEKVKLFQSDFGIVADYFVQKQRNGDYKPEKKEMQYVQEVLQLLSVMTGDHRFEETFSDDTQGGVKTMCDVLDRVELKGKAEGECMVATLMQKLFAAGRMEDAQRASIDNAYRKKLLIEFGLSS